MRLSALLAPLFSVMAWGQATPPPTPISLELRALDDRFHLVDRATPFLEDLDLLLKENGYAASASGGGPKLVLVPSACSVQGGYAYGVIGYLQRPGVDGALRSSIATALRGRESLTPGLRQAEVDAAAALLQRIKPPTAESPLKTLSFPQAPRPGEGLPFVPMDQVRARIMPDPPRLSSFARNRGIHGAVRISIIVGPDGLPQRADVLSGPPELALPALAWTFLCAFAPSPSGAPYRTELAVPFGQVTALELSQPGMIIQRSRPPTAESVKRANGVMPES